ncbi:MAG: MASE3 domain-containing protein [Fusobacteriota bacterium]
MEKQNIKTTVSIMGIFLILFFTTHYNYLLFHSIVELFSIIIAYSIFLIAWNSKKYMKNDYLIFLGIAYFFVGGLDLLHTLSYKGMNIFTDYDYYANQLWVVARMIESISLVIGFLYFQKKKRLDIKKVFFSYLIITIVGILTIFHYKVFPECFIEGQGQTQFKIISEYIINLILIMALIILWKNKKDFKDKIFKYINYSIILTIISELAFTFYVSNYGLSNIVGHYAKILSFYLIYKALIAKGIKEPYDIIFKELNEKQEKLENANKTKNRLFSIISHDLRGSMGAHSGLLEDLNINYDSISPEEKKEMIEMLDESGKNLTNFLNRLLEWSRIHMDKITFDPSEFELNETIKDVIGILKLSAEQKNINIKFMKDSKTMVYADKNMVNAVIRNLLSNAIKFTEENGTIQLKIKDVGSKIKVSIKDDGVGIGDKDQSKIFNESEKYSEKGTEGETGTGLGLFITKEFVNKNNGKIWFESKKNKGTTFHFTLLKPNSHKDIKNNN